MYILEIPLVFSYVLRSLSGFMKPPPPLSRWERPPHPSVNDDFMDPSIRRTPLPSTPATLTPAETPLPLLVAGWPLVDLLSGWLADGCLVG